MEIATDEADLREVVGIVADDIVHVSGDHARGQKITRGIEVSAQIEIAPELCIIYRRISCKVDDICELEHRRNVVQE